jgi:CHAT domain-containing protein
MAPRTWAPLLLLLASATAVSAPDTPHESYAEGERLYKKDLLAEAEVAFRRAMREDIRLRVPCTERLLSIYARIGRSDLAIETALGYRRWLLEQPDASALRLRQLSLQLGDFHLRLGHARLGLAHFERALAPGPSPMPATQRLTADAFKGAALVRLGRRLPGEAVWAGVEIDAKKLLADGGKGLTPNERADCVRILADSYRHRKLLPQAIRTLIDLHELQLAQKDPLGRRNTLQQLADLHGQREEWGLAYRSFLGALDAHGEAGGRDRLTVGDYCRDLARLSERLGWRRRFTSWQKQAIAHYEAVYKDPSLGRPGQAGSLSAYWRLNQLYQDTRQLEKALSLGRAEEQSAGQLLSARMRTDLGSLQTIRGSYKEARGLLRKAVGDLERQRPINLIDLPHALNNLAIAEQATDEYDRAEKLARRGLALYRDEELPGDSVQAEAHNLLGTSLAQRGEYAEAIGEFRAGERLCERLGRAADRQRCDLLLNQALLHKTQGDIANALTSLREATAVFGRYALQDDPGFANFEAAQASLYVAQGKVAAGAATAARVLDRCKRHDIKGIIRSNALHYRALDMLARRDLASAEKTWLAIRADQEEQKQKALIPRTLNYLGLTAELAGRPAVAEARYLEALAIQADAKRAFPATHFITLWRLAGLVERKGDAARGRLLLVRAIEIAEAVRLRTYGDAQQRAGYLAQFAPAFEQLVRSHLAAGEVEAALLALDRGRSRTLLDQLQTSGVDPLAGVAGELGTKLRSREAALKKTIAGIRAKAQLLPPDTLGASRAKALLADLDKAQADYADLWREVYNANPVYRQLVASSGGGDLLARLRETTLSPGTVMLAYHIGGADSHVILVGGKGVPSEAFPLEVDAALAGRIAAAPAASSGGKGTRGLRIRERKNPAPPPAPDRVAPARAVPLTSPVARALIDHYLEQITDPDFRTTRGLRIRPRDPKAPVAVQRLELLGDVMMPAALRDRLRGLKPTTIVVVPDGPLHKLPLEAMLVRSAGKSRYLLEELPPLVYAPSASALALLAERPAPVRKGLPSLLTLSNPAYPQAKADAPADRRDALSILGLRGEMSLLPATADEARRIRRYFPAEKTVALEGSGATERAFTAAVAGRTVLHVAAHGFADDRFGNLFGALAFTPPPAGKKGDADDGFLSLHEIYRLPLGDCELAVLSACSTNVGPQRPLEAGVTLAGAFLAAGAQRVVASHWSVDDRSTAELMGGFFASVTDREKVRGHAHALREARLALLRRDEWASPFYWAPFVLIGPPERRE